MKINYLQMQNYKGFERTYIDFGGYRIVLLFGPNGIGKSSVLEAIQMLGNPRIFDGRSSHDTQLYLRSMIHDEDYKPVADHVLQKNKADMVVHAKFGGHYPVTLTNHGFTTNTLAKVHGGYVFYLDADNPSNLSKFQVTDVEVGRFIELAEAIYGYKVDLDGEVWDERTGEDGVKVTHLFYNDLILTKGKKRVHYPQMSDGEKKIATMIRQLVNPDNTADRDILLIDNIEMHVYFKRHQAMLHKLLQMFPTKQIIATTHSSEMLKFQHIDVKMIDLEDVNIQPRNVITDLDGERITKSGPATIDDFFAEVKAKLQFGKYGEESERARDAEPGFPEWAKSTHNLERCGAAILIDLDEDRTFDPIPNQYVVGMLRPPGRRQPLPRAEDERWIKVHGKRHDERQDGPKMPDVTIQQATVDIMSNPILSCCGGCDCGEPQPTHRIGGIANVTLTHEIDEGNFQRAESTPSNVIGVDANKDPKLMQDAALDAILVSGTVDEFLSDKLVAQSPTINALNELLDADPTPPQPKRRSVFRPIDELKDYVKNISRDLK